MDVTHATRTFGLRRLLPSERPPASTLKLLLALSVTMACASGQDVAPLARPGSSASDTHIASLIETLGKVRAPSSAAVSPDGNYVAWAYNGAHGSELHLTGIAPVGAQDGAWDRVIAPDTIGDVTNLAPGLCAASHPAWSPDGAQLAFLSDCTYDSGAWRAAAQDNLFVWMLKNNTLNQISRLHGKLSALAWSPDGKNIGFLFVENATRSAGALDAMKPWSGVIGEDGVEIQRVYAIDVATGRGNFISYTNVNRGVQFHVYEFAWASDSNHIVFVGAMPPGENNWWKAELYSEYTGYIAVCEEITEGTQKGMMCKSGSAPPGPPELLFNPNATSGPLHGLQIAVPRFSPDGKQIAFIGGLMSDQGSTGGDIYVMPAAGGEPIDVTPGRAASPAFFGWISDTILGITEHVGGNSHIAALDLKTGKDIEAASLTLANTFIAGTQVMSVSISDTPNIAFIRQSFDQPPEVWAGPQNAMKQLTHLNDDIKPSWGKAESIDYDNEGFHIQGWLLYPAGWTPADAANGKKYPLIVNVHGGPSSAVTPRWPTAAYGAIPFSALGYFVFMPNPRGSFGQGEKFTQANIKDFGYGDLHDVLAGMDLIEKRFPIDKDREGLTGWSYGGFMTMFGVTQTTRFKAAVAGAGIANWLSYYGENSIDQWMVPFFGKSVYDDPKVYAHSSPIDFIQRVKTPTLIVVGDRDGECPAPQSFEFWHALKAEGVKTQLVIYPNEGHRFVSREHQQDVLRRALDWFETEMPAVPSTP